VVSRVGFEPVTFWA